MDKWADIAVGIVLALFTGVLTVFGWLLKAVYPTRDQMNTAIKSAVGEAVEDVEKRDDAKDALLIKAVETKVEAQNDVLKNIDKKLDDLLKYLLNHNQRR